MGTHMLLTEPAPNLIWAWSAAPRPLFGATVLPAGASQHVGGSWPDGAQSGESAACAGTLPRAV